MHSEGLLAGEMKHGPLALVDEHLPIIVVATRDRMYAKMLSVVQQLLARGAHLVILCNAGDAEMKDTAASHKCRLIEVRPHNVINFVLGIPLSYLLRALSSCKAGNAEWNDADAVRNCRLIEVRQVKCTK